MKEIPLTKGFVALVDDADYDKVVGQPWRHRIIRGKYQTRVYAIKRVNRDGKDTTINMHNFIMGTLEQLDHRDSNGLNNQRYNLRRATPAQNAANRRKSYGSSKFKGVHRAREKWGSTITKEGVRYDLGTFDDEKLTALVYDYAARKLHGEFAMCNFPEITDPPECYALIDVRLNKSKQSRKQAA